MLKSITLLCNGVAAISVRHFLPFHRIISFSLFYENFRWIDRVYLLANAKRWKIGTLRIYPRKRLKTASKPLAAQALIDIWSHAQTAVRRDFTGIGIVMLAISVYWIFSIFARCVIASLAYTRAREIPFYSMFDFLYLKAWIGKYCVRSPSACVIPTIYRIACRWFAFLLFPNW